MAKRKTYDDDDGRVIANMNVDGMPWYMKAERRSKKQDFSDLDKKEMGALIKGALGASLLIGGAFILGLGLFILFCILVWFR